MYIDHTEVNPKVKMLGITNTSEGQEIKIQILDTYHYGFIKVTVNEDVSNEVSVGPAMISRIERRVQFVNSVQKVMGVLYISGKTLVHEVELKLEMCGQPPTIEPTLLLLLLLKKNKLGITQ